MKRFLLLLISLSVNIVQGQGTILWNEAVNGELGGSAGNATDLGFLNVGTNSVLGTAVIEQVGANWLVHNDVMRFSLMPNTTVLFLGLSLDNPNLALWFGSSDFSNQIGYAPNATFGNLLPQFGIQAIESGTYGMYLANYDFAPAISFANYRLDFVVTPVPEPSTWALLALGSLALWSAARRRRK